MNKHTPTPWIIETAGPAGDSGAPTIVTTSDGAYAIADCLPSVCAVDQVEAAHNAAFIVHAVNAYEELLKIVKDLRNRSFDPTFEGWDFKKLDQVIAKAKGE